MRFERRIRDQLARTLGFARMTIANSDAGTNANTHEAIHQAYRPRPSAAAQLEQQSESYTIRATSV